MDKRQVLTELFGKPKTLQERILDFTCYDLRDEYTYIDFIGIWGYDLTSKRARRKFKKYIFSWFDYIFRQIKVDIKDLDPLDPDRKKDEKRLQIFRDIIKDTKKFLTSNKNLIPICCANTSGEIFFMLNPDDNKIYSFLFTYYEFPRSIVMIKSLQGKEKYFNIFKVSYEACQIDGEKWLKRSLSQKKPYNFVRAHLKKNPHDMFLRL